MIGSAAQASVHPEEEGEPHVSGGDDEEIDEGDKAEGKEENAKASVQRLRISAHAINLMQFPL